MRGRKRGLQTPGSHEGLMCRKTRLPSCVLPDAQSKAHQLALDVTNQRICCIVLGAHGDHVGPGGDATKLNTLLTQFMHGCNCRFTLMGEVLMGSLQTWQSQVLLAGWHCMLGLLRAPSSCRSGVQKALRHFAGLPCPCQILSSLEHQGGGICLQSLVRRLA